MRKGVRVFCVCAGLVLAAFLFSSLGYSAAKATPTGSVIGFIYDKDGTTPLPGAVVKLKNLVSGAIYESTVSDDYGIFKVQGIETGLYTYGVVTEKGDYNADNMVGFQVGENEVAKLSIALTPYEEEVAAALSEIYKEQERSGEVLVGAIADFEPASRIAQVQVVNGLLRVKDKIHTRGKTTNFYQEVTVLKVGNSLAKHILKGQVGSVQMEQEAAKGDLVYVVNENKKVMPFFLAPVGIAAVMAGSSAVTYGIVIIPTKCRPASAKRN